MGWAVQVNDLEFHDLWDALDDNFVASYSEPYPGIRHEFEQARIAAEEIANGGFVNKPDGRRFNVSLSGHVRADEDDEVEEFVSIIVTQRKPVAQGDPAED